MSFSAYKGWVIPEGTVVQVADEQGVVLWRRNKQRLPLEYQEVAWLEGTGDQCLETNYVVDENDALELQYELTTAESGDNFLFGSQRRDSGVGMWCSSYGTSYAWYVRFGYASSTSKSSTEYQRSGVLQLSKGLFVVNGETVAEIKYSAMPVGTLALFGRKNAEGEYVGARMKSGGFRITRDGAVVHDYVPCYRKSDNEAGMYDIVSNEFLTNVGTGEFAVGSEVV